MIDRFKPDFRKVCSSKRSSARRKHLRFALKPEYLELLWKNQGGRCAVTGTLFSDKLVQDAFVKQPLLPSLDRIEPNKGYIPGNVRFVLTMVNFAINQWGDAIFAQVAKSMAKPAGSVAFTSRWIIDKRIKLDAIDFELATASGDRAKKLKQSRAGVLAAITKGAPRKRKSKCKS